MGVGVLLLEGAADGSDEVGDALEDASVLLADDGAELLLLSIEDEEDSAEDEDEGGGGGGVEDVVGFGV